MKYPLVLDPFDQEDKILLKRVVDGGQYTMGPEVKAFETEFAAMAGSRFAVMVNSGSSANLAGVAALLYGPRPKLKRGDEVIVPAVGWATTWAPLQQLGLSVRVVDVDKETLNLSVDAIRKAITPKTKMVMTVSILGNPLNFTEIAALCHEKGLILFEDNCESIGALHKQKWCGTFGLLGTFSFFYSHHISTIEGGMIVTDNEELYHLCLALRAHGWTREVPREAPLRQSSASAMKEQYRFVVPGFNLRPLEFSGALGRRQLMKLPGILEQRRKNADEFLKMMKKHPKMRAQVCRDGDSSWYAFTMVLEGSSESERNRLFEFLSKNGIESRMVTGGNFLQHEMSRYFDCTFSGTLDVATEVHEQGLFVANHGVPMSDMLQHLHMVLTEFGL